ncbi:dynein regulatory complex protein 10 [Micropterus dolomieu]|uniref:dynein regulatory complex protein 10 n=1 Tax=Micropterus dolomieu TaxID=147949 RepID=UPI001E8CD889|nr:dynein regulatory complex protein 10 [Micropterus dolomieu]XP_045891518.1 dynein regulatory complex protein 10 [Micropterus dolomieu]
MSAKGATVLSEAKTQSDDPLKDRGLSQKKQLSLEVQRISSILENCISQVEIAATLPAVLQSNSASGVADQDLSRALQEHQMLEERLETLEHLKQESDGEQEGEARERAKVQLEKDIKNSVRNLLRTVRARPDAMGLRAELVMEVGESEYILIRELQKFHCHMVEKLPTIVDEELQLVLYKQVPSPPAFNLEHMVSVEEGLATAMKEVDAKISQKKDEIENLRGSLQTKNTPEAGMSLLADKQCQSLMKTSKLKQTSIKREIDQLNIQLNNMILENRQAEKVIQEKNEKVETEIEYLLQHFDTEIEETQATLELNEMDYEREEEELRKLEKPLSVLEVEYNQVMEKRRLAEKKRKEEMRELLLKTKAAIFAQAWWRGYSTRKALKNKGKSKKAKKGKGKKTK